jgi:hypothetical protein
MFVESARVDGERGDEVVDGGPVEAGNSAAAGEGGADGVGRMVTVRKIRHVFGSDPPRGLRGGEGLELRSRRSRLAR